MFAEEITSGAYAITNVVNGKVYIGSTVNLKRRLDEHRRGLRGGAHGNPHLQSSWNKYGEDAFEFDILEYLDNLEELHLAEQFWVDIYREEGKTLYNLAIPGRSPMLGREHTEESKRQMSKSQKNRPPTSEETKRRMSKTRKGKKPSKKHCQKLSEANRGKTLSEEHKQKLSEASKAAWARGAYDSPETRRRKSEAAKGHKHSEEVKRGISVRMKGNTHALGHKHSEESRRNMSDGQHNKSPEAKARKSRKCSDAMMSNQNALGCVRSEKTRRKMSESAKRRAPATEETRHKISEGICNMSSKAKAEKSRKISEVNAKPYPAFINEYTGEFIPAGINLSAMCREREVVSACMRDVSKGRQRQHRGWVLAGDF